MSEKKKPYVPPTIDDIDIPTPQSVVVLAVLVAGVYVVVGTTAGGVVVVAAEAGGVVHAGVAVYTNAEKS